MPASWATSSALEYVPAANRSVSAPTGHGLKGRGRNATGVVRYDVGRPVAIRIQAARCLTAPDAAKRTLAVQLALPGPGLYKPGDAIGLVCPNDDRTVDALLTRLRLDGSMVRPGQRHRLGANPTLQLMRPLVVVARPTSAAAAPSGSPCRCSLCPRRPSVRRARAG